MRPGGGKAKGNGFENKVAKTLSEKLSPLNFRRSQQSGAIVGGQNEKIIENFSFEALRLFVGDVVPTNESDENVPNFRFSIETKFYKEQDKLVHLVNGKGKIYGWMDEARVDAKKLDLDPLLIFKFNNTPIFMCIDKSIEYPDEISYLVLPNGDKIAHFDDVIEFKDWWLL